MTFDVMQKGLFSFAGKYKGMGASLQEQPVKVRKTL